MDGVLDYRRSRRKQGYGAPSLHTNATGKAAMTGTNIPERHRRALESLTRGDDGKVRDQEGFLADARLHDLRYTCASKFSKPLLLFIYVSSILFRSYGRKWVTATSLRSGTTAEVKAIPRATIIPKCLKARVRKTIQCFFGPILDCPLLE